MSLAKRVLFTAHRAAAKLGLHVLPRHYYSPVVDLDTLEATRARWARRSAMRGVAWDVDAQAQRLREICLPHREEYADNEAYRRATQGRFGPGYGPIEAQALHALVRQLRPRRIVEVGSGVSSACLLEAAARNEGDGAPRAQITCIEPHPSQALAALRGVDLVEAPVQAAPSDLFAALGAGDLLFIDSSHVAKTGSDVYYLVLEVLPGLRAGVVVHFHDIYLPYDYSPLSLKTLWHWNETAFLHAFLVHNARVRTLFCMSLLHHERPEILAELFPGYAPEPLSNGLVADAAPPLAYPRRHFPSSLVLEILEGDPRAADR
ncbi:MAG: class I SAM-dependent methyltransferase [Myxococcales bacterium]|nr:class I SAM-dependent methyltransferase [Myxococcales bacterium]